MVRFIIYTYLALLVGLRCILFFPRNAHQSKIPDQYRTDVQNCSALFDNSDQLDRNEITRIGKVTQSGHFFFDLFFIKSYKLNLIDGCSIRVFSHRTTPLVEDKVWVRGTFRQIYHGTYFTWVGLIEIERKDQEKSSGLSPPNVGL